MIPIAFKFQARFPSAALVVPSGFNPEARGGAAQDWYPTRGLNPDNHRARVAAPRKTGTRRAASTPTTTASA